MMDERSVFMLTLVNTGVTIDENKDLLVPPRGLWSLFGSSDSETRDFR